MRVKTTLELERPLYLALKKKAAEEKKTLKKVMDEIIVAWMQGETKSKKIIAADGDPFPPARPLNPKIDTSNPQLLKDFLEAEEADHFLNRR